MNDPNTSNDSTPHADDAREDSHGWVASRIEAYLAGGLNDAERRALEDHAAACAACAAALASARKEDEQLRSFFQADHPRAGLEDRLIRGLRESETNPRMRIVPRAVGGFGHPYVRRAAIVVAATLVLGTIGYVAGNALNHGLPGFPQFASRNANDVVVEFAGDYLDQKGQSEQLALGLTGGLIPDIGRTTVSVPNGGLNPVHGRDTVAFFTPRQLQSNAGAKGMTGALPAQGSSEIRQHVTALRTGVNSRTNGFQDHLVEVPDFDQVPNFDLTAANTGGQTLQQPTTIIQRETEARQFPRLPPGIDIEGGTAADLNAKGADAGWTYAQTPSTGAPILYMRARGAAQSFNPFEQLFAGGDKTVTGPYEPFGDSFKPSDLSQSELAADVVAAAMKKPVELSGIVYLTDSGERLNHKWGAHQKSDTALLGLPADESSAIPADAPSPEARAAEVPFSDASTGSAPSAPTPATTPTAIERKIIRNGEMDFQVDNFDAAFARVRALAAEEGGFVSSTQSQRLPNGKMKGVVTVRVPPDHLDGLILKLRGIGELLTQQVTAEDVTKQYTDLSSELTAAQAMQQRLLDLIKNSKGDVKDLIEAEKQLGDWREKIEHVQGEIRYYNSLIALSTMQIGLTEKDLHAAVTAVETETIDAGVEVEDVEAARDQVIKAIEAAKGSVLESDLKKFDAGQYAATITADLPVDAAGPLIDRLKQVGRMARLDISRKEIAQTEPAADGQNASGQTAGDAAALKVDRLRRRFNISLYNLANVEPRQTTEIDVVCPDVQAAYRAIVGALEPVKGAAPGGALGRLVSSSMNNKPADESTSLLKLQTASSAAADMENVIRAAGQVMRYSVTQNPDTNNTTTAKRGFIVKLVSQAVVPARETRQLSMVADHVADAYRAMLEALRAAGARVLASNLSQQSDDPAALSSSGGSSASLSFEISRDKLAALEAQLAGGSTGKSASHPLGQVITRRIVSAPISAEAIDSKVRFDVQWFDAGALPPLETDAISLEVSQVPGAVASLAADAQSLGGRIIDQQLSSQPGGRAGAAVVIDIPAASAGNFLEKIKSLGVIRSDVSRSAAESRSLPLSRVRYNITLGNTAQLRPDEGVGPTFTQALHTSRVGLVLSIGWLVIALCLVSPWALLIWGIWRLTRRGRRRKVQVA